MTELIYSIVAPNAGDLVRSAAILDLAELHGLDAKLACFRDQVVDYASDHTVFAILATEQTRCSCRRAEILNRGRVVCEAVEAP